MSVAGAAQCKWGDALVFEPAENNLVLATVCAMYTPSTDNQMIGGCILGKDTFKPAQIIRANGIGCAFHVVWLGGAQCKEVEYLQ